MLMIRTVFFCAIILCFVALNNAAPSRFQRLECPDENLKIYVNATESDRIEYQINETSANSLLECTQKCYNNPQCFSLKYREADPRGCKLTSFVPETCLDITLVPVAGIKYDTSTLITIDCITCQSTKESGTRVSSGDTLMSTVESTNAPVSASSLCDPSSMQCRKDLWFIADEVINSESLDLLEETVTANSVQECAKMCFSRCCKMAVYSSNKKKCQFTKESASSSNDDSCETKPFSFYVKQYNESNRTRITCVTCDSPSKSDRRMLMKSSENRLGAENSAEITRKDENEKVEKPSTSLVLSQFSSSEQPIIASALDTFSSSQDKESLSQPPRPLLQFMEMACIVVFEVDPNADIAHFRSQDHVEADRADHCAYLCYRDACTAAVFIPPATPGRKGTCERRFDIAEKCNATLRRDYYYKTTKSIYLQCFRCLPEKPQTKATHGAVTPQPELSIVTVKKQPSETLIITQAEATLTTLTSTLESSMELETFGTKEVKSDISGTTVRNMEIISAEGNKDESKQTEGSNLTETTTPKISDEVKDSSTEQTLESTKEDDIVTSESEDSVVTLSTAAEYESTTIGKIFETDLTTSENDFGANVFETPSSATSDVEHTEQSVQVNEFVQTTKSKIEASESSQLLTSEISEKFTKATTSAGADFSVGFRPRVEAEVKDSHNTFTPASELKGTFGTQSATEETMTSPFVVFTERNGDSADEHSSSTTMPLSTHAGIDEQKEAVHRPVDDEQVEVTRSAGSSAVSVGSTEAISSNPEGENEATAPSNSFATSSANADKPTLSLSKESSKKPSGNAFYTYLQGCIVTFQADPHSERPAQSSTGFQASTIARTAEVCAGRCYQDGCTGAKYDPSSKECVLGYGGKQICNKGPEHFFYEANETIWIHCTGCKLHKPGDEGINIMIHSLKSKAAKETTITNTVRETATSGMVTLSATVTETEEGVQSTKPEETLEMSSGTTVGELSLSTAEGEAKTENEITEVSTSSSLPSTSLVEATEILVQTELSTAPEELTTETAGKKVETPEEELNIDGVPTSAIAEKAEELVNSEKSSVPFETGLFGHGCTISFQAKPIASFPEALTAKFISRGTTATVEECAKQCYMDGCTGAKFSPINQECSLIFGDHHQCDEKEEKYHSIEATEALWIHCISCKREFTENTLGLLTEDTTDLAVDVGTTSDKSVGETPEPLVGVSGTSLSLGSERISEKESTTKEAELDFQAGSGTESVRFPANVSEVGNEESTATGEEVDTAPVVEEQGTLGFSTVQPSRESSEHFDLNQQIGAISTEANTMKQSSKPTDDDEQEKTVQPDDLISVTLQTPLNIPTDDLGLLNTNAEISSITSSVAAESSTISPLKEIEFGGRKDQKEDSVEFQKEDKPTMLLVEITASSVSSNEVTVNPEIAKLEEQKFNEVTDDTIAAAANVISNISSVPEATTETPGEIKPTHIPELSVTEPEVSSSSIGSEAAFMESDAKVTLFNVDEAFHTTEASVKSGFESEVPDGLNKKVSSKAILTPTGSTSEVDEEETSTVLISQEEEETSNIPEKKSEEKSIFDGTLLPGSVENSITAQPFVQENVDDIIKKVIQSVSEKDISAADTKSELSDSSVSEGAKEVGEPGVVADRAEKLSIIEDTSAKDTTTEPPVQAVSDLISVLSQNSKIEGLIGQREKGSLVMDGSMLRMDKNEVMTTGIQEDSARNSLQNVVKVSSFKGATAECSGRIEFEISRIDDLSSLNISSKVSTQSPAACAMKCYETANCVLAAYVPSRNDESTKATCMLTSNSGVCSPEEKFLAQYKSDTSPFVISCLKCTKCDYTISAVTELTRIRQAEVVEPALSVGQCAEICWRYNCTVSQYDYKSNLCSLTSIKGQDDCPKEMPIAVESDELVLLKCVRCFT